MNLIRPGGGVTVGVGACPSEVDANTAVIAGLTRQSIFFAKMMDHQNSGVPEFWQFTWTQIGNIRFAVGQARG